MSEIRLGFFESLQDRGGEPKVHVEVCVEVEEQGGQLVRLAHLMREDGSRRQIHLVFIRGVPCAAWLLPACHVEEEVSQEIEGFSNGSACNEADGGKEWKPKRLAGKVKKKFCVCPLKKKQVANFDENVESL